MKITKFGEFRAIQTDGEFDVHIDGFHFDMEGEDNSPEAVLKAVLLAIAADHNIDFGSMKEHD